MDAAPGPTGDAAYHRLASGKRVRALVEPLVVVGLFLVVTVVSFGIAGAIAGTSKFDELDRMTTLGLTLGGLATLVPIAMIAARAGGRPAGQLSSVFGRVRWRWLFVCVGFALVAKLVSLFGYGILSHFVEGALGVASESDSSGWVGWADYLPMLVLVLLVVPVQAAGEEYVMRGTLMQVIGAWTRSPWPAILVSAVVFALIHMTTIEASTFIFAMGIVTAWLTVKTGGLEAGIAEHAINNLVIFVIGAAIAPEKFDQVDLNADTELGPTISQTAGLLLYASLVLRRYRRDLPLLARA